MPSMTRSDTLTSLRFKTNIGYYNDIFLHSWVVSLCALCSTKGVHLLQAEEPLGPHQGLETQKVANHFLA